MFQDRVIYNAITKLRQRSERQPDLAVLEKTFVDPGIVDELDNNNHQVVYGRRGTGKTHCLRVLQYRVGHRRDHVPVYLDARVLGSSQQFSNPGVALPERCLALFLDILTVIHNAVLSHLLERAENPVSQSLDALDSFAKVIAVQWSRATGRTITEIAKHGSESTASSSLTLEAPLKGSVNFGGTATASGSVERSTTFTEQFIDKIHFSEVLHYLRSALDHSSLQLYVLFDEWASIPADVQPLLAEFLKRGLLPADRVTLKIASMEYRSCFRTKLTNQYVGLELGADISTAPRLDDYFIFDANPADLKDAYAEMLYRHLASELPYGYLEKRYQVWDVQTFVNRCFDGAALEELCRSSEGVVRDLINIFTLAFKNIYRPRDGFPRGKLMRSDVLEAASQWFEHDKRRNLDGDDESALNDLAGQCISALRSRFFLVPSSEERKQWLQRLVDARVVHEVKRGLLDIARPATSYTAYALDYGLYVGILSQARSTTREMSARRQDAAIIRAFSQVPNPFEFVLARIPDAHTRLLSTESNQAL